MSHKAIKAIMDKLEEVFAEMDAKVLANTQEWAKGRAEAIREFWKSDRPKELRGNSWVLYRELHALAGGKTWYGILHGRAAADIENFVVKNCKATVDRRNASIAKKLIKAEVTEVLSNEFAWTKDGFDGIFHVSTDKGEKRVKIETIYAGGYNVQCLHLRVLVNVK
jgi:hypothetical protein